MHRLYTLILIFRFSLWPLPSFPEVLNSSLAFLVLMPFHHLQGHSREVGANLSNIYRKFWCNG